MKKIDALKELERLHDLVGTDVYTILDKKIVKLEVRSVIVKISKSHSHDDYRDSKIDDVYLYLSKHNTSIGNISINDVFLTQHEILNSIE